VFTSKISGRASWFFVMLVQRGKWYFQSQLILTILNKSLPKKPSNT